MQNFHMMSETNAHKILYMQVCRLYRSVNTKECLFSYFNTFFYLIFRLL